MAVVDLSGPSEFEGVAFFQPIEISGLRIEGPVDGLLSPLEVSPSRRRWRQRDELIDDNGGDINGRIRLGVAGRCKWRWRHR